MGALLGLVAGCGALLVWQVVAGVPPMRRSPRRDGRLLRLLRAAGADDVTPARLMASCVGVGGAAGVAMLVVSRTPTIALAFALLAGGAPVVVLRRRAARRQAVVRAAWPDVVDDLSSAVRAGMSLPEAVADISRIGPEPMRPAFARFAGDVRATGRFGDALDRLKADLADPVADRVVESLRLAREVGGSDLGRVLRTLSASLRDEARLRGEVAARQSWTVNGARLAVAAPWLVLGFLSLRPEAVAAYGTPLGAVVLAVVAGASLVAYRVMLRLGRLPEEARVLT